MPRQHQDSLLDAARQGEEGHETAATLLGCVLIVCITLLIFTYLTRKSLCEIRYRDTNREVAAFMAYESAK
ncbi:Hok/Gef family protein [Salmonella enterica]|nr:Hok/Gef family protein [Salmonella enterica]